MGRDFAFDLFLSGTAAIGLDSLPPSLSVIAGRPAGPLMLAFRFLADPSLPLAPAVALDAIGLAIAEDLLGTATGWVFGNKNEGSKLRRLARPSAAYCTIVATLLMIQ